MSCSTTPSSYNNSHTHSGTKSPDVVCWFCKKGRHDECMVKMPAAEETDGGPHDCTFDTVLIQCRCGHCRQ